MSKQEIFDRVAKHLIEQDEPSAYGEDVPVCRYRLTSPDGKQLSCAIGCLIPDDEYDERLEGYGLAAINTDWNVPSVNRLIDEVGIEYMDLLQSAHDRAAEAMAASGVGWDQAIRAQLFDLAKKLDLDFTVLGDVTALREAS